MSVVRQPFGVLVGWIDAQLALRSDDPIRRDIVGVEARDERRDLFAAEAQNGAGRLVDLGKRCRRRC